MTEPSLHYSTCPDSNQGHRMAWWQWGTAGAPHVVLCVHGLTRQGRDFDVLAQALCQRADHPIRVICPDVVGRGRSDWLKDPMGYQIATYCADMLALLAELRPATLDWVGTSMGAIIGIALCGSPQLALPVPLRRLLINDIGPTIQWHAVQRIGAYLGQTGRFASLQQAADAMLAISTTFGPHSAQQWLELSRHMVRPLDDASGDLTLHYDPALAVPFQALTPELAAQGEAMVWQLYDNLRADTLLTRGEQSDLLSPQTASAMTQRGPRARLVEFDGVGHAPTFIAQKQVDTACDFLLR